MIRPDQFDAANAIGAAIASVSGRAGRIYRLSSGGRAAGGGQDQRRAALAEASGQARERPAAAGAGPGSAGIIEMKEIPGHT
jgi:hypothetical protein